MQPVVRFVLTLLTVLLATGTVANFSSASRGVQAAAEDARGHRLPIADAGIDRAVAPGDAVVLDGSRSLSPTGARLAYQWTIVQQPAGSLAALDDPLAVKPRFEVDLPGDYMVRLRVSGGRLTSAPDHVTISTENVAPVADASRDRVVTLGSEVILDASGSTDFDGDVLSYNWRLVETPAGSAATLDNTTVLRPAFFVGLAGTYIAELTVSDGELTSAPARVVLSTRNLAPVAEAGPDQTAPVGADMQVDPAGTSDSNGDRLTATWSLVATPPGSSTKLSGTASSRPQITVDVPGTYVIQLAVHDGVAPAAFDTATISTANTAPVANAGADQAITSGQEVHLDGAASSDIDGNLLTYRWALIAAPAGSRAVFDNPAFVHPSFAADAPGTYVAQLIVDDGRETSLPDTVVLSTDNIAPRANAGADQTANSGDLPLDGSGSQDADGDPLTYRWSALAAVSNGDRAGSSLADPEAVAPSLALDGGTPSLIQLVVNDGLVDSAPDTVLISPDNSRPVADAGEDREVSADALVTLDGNRSADIDGDPLTFRWALLTEPDGSAASLSDPAATQPNFKVDVPGTYVAQLIAIDGILDSLPDTVVIETAEVPPVEAASEAPLVERNDLRPGHAATPTASISVEPPSIAAGESSTITWVSGNADSCTGTNFSTGGALAGSTMVSPTATTTYKLICTSAAGTEIKAATIAVDPADKRRDAPPAVLSALALQAANVQVPAFPGAEGGGATSVGGRGGAVIEVTNLNDSGTGSLRACVQATGPRTCVFRVGGTISLTSGLMVNNPYLTIAGQTAPGGGIQLRGTGVTGSFPNAEGMINIRTHDVIVRYIRVRVGTTSLGENLGDAIAIFGSTSNTVNNIIIDHVSMSWAADENFSIWSQGAHIEDITLSYSIMSEGLDGKGALLGSHIAEARPNMLRLDMHHNYFANNSDRNPLTALNGIIANNIVYNWGVDVGTAFMGGVVIDVAGNRYKGGPNSDGGSNPDDLRFFPAGGTTCAGNGGNCLPGDPSVYLEGNVFTINGTPTSPSADNWPHLEGWSGTQGEFAVNTAFRRTTAQTRTFPIRLDPAENLHLTLLPRVGAYQRLTCDGSWAGARDSVDTRVVQDFTNGTGNANLTSESQVGGFPIIAGGTPCADADRDGMPDTWELAHGLNPNDAADRNGDLNGDGYTNLEEFLNGTNPRGGESAPPPTASLTANPTSISSGQSSTLSWSSTDATSCTGTNFSTGGAISGSRSVSPAADTTYTLACTGLGGNTSASAVVKVAAPAPAGFPVSLTGAPPEEASVAISASKPANAAQARLSMVVNDADFADEGQLFINGNGPLALFGNQLGADQATVTTSFSTPASWWVDGANTLRFRHTATAGYRVDSAQVSFTTSTAPTSGLVAHFALDETSGTTAKDSAGGHDATVSGATWSTGKIGNALLFDGVNDIATTRTSLPALGSQYTVAAWVRVRTTGGQQRFLDHHSGTLTLRIYNGAWNFHWNPSSTGSDHVSGPRATTNQWVHLAGTHDGTTARLYVNGKLSASKARASKSYGSARLSIGGNAKTTTLSSLVNGLVDDVRIYDRALAGSEIQTLYEGSATSTSITTAAARQ